MVESELIPYLRWAYFADAVLTVFEENVTTDQDEGTKAKADSWCWSKSLRKSMLKRTRLHWCKTTGFPSISFPFRKDFVVKFYMRIRKRNEQERAEFRAEIDRALLMQSHPR
jgi:hypothetical protein